MSESSIRENRESQLASGSGKPDRLLEERESGALRNHFQNDADKWGDSGVWEKEL